MRGMGAVSSQRRRRWWAMMRIGAVAGRRPRPTHQLLRHTPQPADLTTTSSLFLIASSRTTAAYTRASLLFTACAIIYTHTHTHTRDGKCAPLRMPLRGARTRACFPPAHATRTTSTLQPSPHPEPRALSALFLSPVRQSRRHFFQASPLTARFPAAAHAQNTPP